MTKVLNQKISTTWAAYNGDCVEVIKGIPDNSIHYSIFSPPFASLFTYSDSDWDMGNCQNYNEFIENFEYLTHELNRVIMPGRLVSIHCMDLLATLTKDGFIGLKDFPGLMIKMFQDAGFIYHSRVCIWKDPLLQAVRTKVLSLSHKQISKDSSRCNMGLPDYIVTMRKPGENPEPISHGRGFERYVGDNDEPTAAKTNNARTNKYSHMVWQRYASPVWMDVNQTNTLNVKAARAENDEKHICPMNLTAIDRCLELWSNEGDTVLSPFAGVGSEGYVATKMGRNFIGIELKESYYNQMVKNLELYENSHKQMDLF